MMTIKTISSTLLAVSVGTLNSSDGMRTKAMKDNTLPPFPLSTMQADPPEEITSFTQGPKEFHMIFTRNNQS